MFVLHAHWQPIDGHAGPGDFRFWAETSDAALPGRRKVNTRSVQAHPFGASLPAVRSLLRRLADGGKLPLALDGESAVALALPTTKTGPLPSPALLHEWDLSGAGEPVLAPWQMAACAPDLSSALILFLSLPGDADLPPAIRIGEDVRFWQAASHYALELLAQQKTLPALVPEGERGAALAARWQPVTDGPRDAPRLAQLAKAMPPVCRGQWSLQGAAAGGAPDPYVLVTGFLEAVTDALARDWGRTAALAAAPPGAAAPSGAAQEWLSALVRGDARLRGSSA